MLEAFLCLAATCERICLDLIHGMKKLLLVSLGDSEEISIE